MVASAIVAMTLTFACRAVGDGARRTNAAERSRLALLEARSRLDEVGADIPLSPGVSSGQDGALVWRVEVGPAEGADPSSHQLMDVVVGVSAGGRPIASLHSLRMAPAATVAQPGV